MRLVSFVLPTLREDEIARTLEKLATHLEGIAGSAFEIILVDDSPPDVRAELVETVRAFDAKHAPRVAARVLDGTKKGKGAAVRIGALDSRGEIVFTMDADLPVPLRHIEELIAEIDRGHDVVIGERPIMRNLGEPVRFVLSRCLLFAARAIVFQSNEFEDTQCGFKAFRGDVIRSLARRQRIDGGMYDIEYLYVAVQDGLQIARVPVVPNEEWRPSRIDAWKCLRTDPRDLLAVKAAGIAGKYGK